MMRPLVLAAACVLGATASQSVSRQPHGVKAVVKLIKTNGIKGHSTYHLIVDASKCTFCHGIYAMAGTSEGSMHFPPAWNIEQSKSKFAQLGSNVGEPNPKYYAYSHDLKWDSWLALGINLPRDVANPTSIGSPAIPFGAWDQAGLDVNDGAIFYMDISTAPKTKNTVIAQITVKSGKAFKAAANFRGTSNDDEGPWGIYLTWQHDGKAAGPAKQGRIPQAVKANDDTTTDVEADSDADGEDIDADIAAYAALHSVDSEGDEDSGAAVPFVVYVGGAGVLLLVVYGVWSRHTRRQRHDAGGTGGRGASYMGLEMEETDNLWGANTAKHS